MVGWHTLFGLQNGEMNEMNEMDEMECFEMTGMFVDYVI